MPDQIGYLFSPPHSFTAFEIVPLHGLAQLFALKALFYMSLLISAPSGLNHCSLAVDRVAEFGPDAKQLNSMFLESLPSLLTHLSTVPVYPGIASFPGIFDGISSASF